MAEMDELQAAFERLVSAFNARDIEALGACVDDGVVQFGLISPFPRNGKADLLRALDRFFTHHESLAWRPRQPEYRIVGATGLVWGNDAIERKPKDGPIMTVYTRSTTVFAQTDEQWRVVATHYSPLLSDSVAPG